MSIHQNESGQWVVTRSYESGFPAKLVEQTLGVFDDRESAIRAEVFHARGSRRRKISVYVDGEFLYFDRAGNPWST